MRVAALYDIHGNLPALEAVLAEVAQAGVDRIVVGGDVFPGPLAHEVLARLTSLETPVDFIHGNCDVALAECLAGGALTGLPESFRPVLAWNAERLDAAQRARVAGWPATRRLAIPPLGDVLFCHATPRDVNEIFTRLTDEARLVPVFEPARAAVVVCGHTHMPFDRRVGATRVVNAGSVGMPFGGTGAYWLLLGPGVEPRRTVYDAAAAAERLRGSGYPLAEEFASRYVLDSPAEADVLARFGAAELR